MRIITDPATFGRAPVRKLRFSKADLAALKRAEAIADEARQLWRRSVDYDTEGEEIDTALGMIAVGVEIVGEGFPV